MTRSLETGRLAKFRRGGVSMPSRSGSVLAYAGTIAVVMALLALPLEDYYAELMSVLVVLIFAFAWQPVVGLLGELAMSHVLAWGAGGYATVLALNEGMPYWAGMLLGVAAAAALGATTFLCILIGKLDGFYIAVFTLILVQTATAAVNSSYSLGHTEGLVANSIPLDFRDAYVWMVVLAAILFLVVRRLLKSFRGLLWIAIRDDREIVDGLGWSSVRERASAYIVTSAIVSLGGSLQALSYAYISPQTALGLHITILALLALYLGGPVSTWGPLLGVIFFQGISVVVTRTSTSVDAVVYAQIAQYAIALVVVVVVLQNVRDRKGITLGPAKVGWKARRDAAASPAAKRSAQATVVNEGDSSRVAEGAVLHVESVAKSFGSLQVLRDVSFELRPGEVLGLVGPNGAGKSTLCDLISGAKRADAGTIRFGNLDVSRTSLTGRAQLGLARSYQSARIFPTLTLAENVAIASRQVGTHRAASLLRELGVSAVDKLGSSATLIERRIVEIARATCVRKNWLLFDEPLAGLATSEHEIVMRLLRQISSQGRAVLIIEHLIPVIAPLVDRMIVLDRGVIIANGTPDAVLRDPDVISSYLGDSLVLNLEEPAPEVPR